VIERTPSWDQVVSDVVETLLDLGDTGRAENIVDFYSAPSRPPRWRLGITAQLRCSVLLGVAGGDRVVGASAVNAWAERHVVRLQSALQAVQDLVTPIRSGPCADPRPSPNEQQGVLLP
jgi:hypothetical protein